MQYTHQPAMTMHEYISYSSITLLFDFRPKQVEIISFYGKTRISLGSFITISLTTDMDQKEQRIK